MTYTRTQSSPPFRFEPPPRSSTSVTKPHLVFAAPRLRRTSSSPHLVFAAPCLRRTLSSPPFVFAAFAVSRLRRLAVSKHIHVRPIDQQPVNQQLGYLTGSLVK
ncbi:hypothetical protein CVT26_002992 [Gymnopilus dilepis]|uniref:Uncharacterized protein n=1 Tax=Gymnopilus dilepis TaxID=231916 RepID=A0A409Y4E7_9AGAR|nr:hypothetical protein CVT26_002992 [Gymnopilus dilepis]